MSGVKKSSLKTFLKKHDLYKITDRRDTSKSRIKKGLCFFITNPTKHKGINVPKLTSFIKENIDTKNTSLYFTSCYKCLKNEYCQNIGDDRYLQYTNDDGKEILLCYTKKNKRKKGDGYSIKIGFHIDFKFTFDGKFVNVVDYFNWTVDNSSLLIESVLKRAPVLPDHIKTKEELELEAVISLLKTRILKKRVQINELEEKLNIFKPGYL